MKATGNQRQEFFGKLAPFTLKSVSRKVRAMTKTLDVITDAIRNTKHPFRQVDNRPDKPKKHRYERRKVKEYIRLGDWVAET